MNAQRPPDQAVILAGGRGKRLRPFSDSAPKPMIPIHGKPFLEYVVTLLRDQGIRRIVMLLGYLPDMICDYFGDGRSLGVHIEYSITPANNSTCQRLRHARERLDEFFLLLYCDNYWPVQLSQMWERFSRAQAQVMTTIYSNRDNYSRSNVTLDSEGYVLRYDRSRTEKGLQGVDIGFGIWNKSIVDRVPPDDCPLEAALYSKLARERQLLGYVTDHRYYSIGSPERLPFTERFLSRRPAIILDRDGVLNKRPPRGQYVRRVQEFKWLDNAREALSLLCQAGYKVIVISNQAGVARGFMTVDDVARIHQQMRREAEEAGGSIDAIYWCPHGWDEGCECRKPKPGMLFQAQRDFDLDLSRTLMVGDDERDALAAQQAGSPCALVTADNSLWQITSSLLSGKLPEFHSPALPVGESYVTGGRITACAS